MPRYKHNLVIGQRFGRLRVSGESGRSASGDVLWECKCDCGNVAFARASTLVNGNTQSCGCLHKDIVAETGRNTKLNLIGFRVGMLEVIAETKEKTNCGHYKWLCKCDCGNEVILAGNYIKSGNKTNCGCIKKKRKKYKSDKGIISKDLPLYETYKDQLYCEDTFLIREHGLDLLGVKCTYCGRIYRPTRTEVKNRLVSLSGTTTAENRFYCSENCKKACPTYRQVNYPKGFKKATSREVQPELRQLVLKRDSYTCQYEGCGKTTEEAELHCHHKEGINLNPIESADIDMCITLCKEHHKAVHKKKDCRYIDLQCKGD